MFENIQQMLFEDILSVLILNKWLTYKELVLLSETSKALYHFSHNKYLPNTLANITIYNIDVVKNRFALYLTSWNNLNFEITFSYNLITNHKYIKDKFKDILSMLENYSNIKGLNIHGPAIVL